MLIARIMEAGGTLLAVLGLLLQPIAGYGMVTLSCSTCKGANGTHASGAVRIDFDGRGGGLHYYGVSQGTKISGNRLLTHHHYEIPLESLETLTLTLTDVKGNRATVAVNTQTIVAVDAGTTIIPLADTPSLDVSQSRPNQDRLTLDAGA